MRELTLRELPSPPAQVQLENEGNHYGPHLSTLPIPNPFKSMMSRSTEHLATNGNESCILPGNGFKPTLGGPHDVGIIIADTVLSGLKTRRSADGKLSALAWSHRELSVSHFIS